MKTTIYKLINPINNTILYIGATTNELSNRLSQHLYDARNRESNKSKFIYELLESGIIPIIESIEEVELNIYKEREEYWLNYYINQGHNLYNTYSKASGIVINRSFESIQRSANAKNIIIRQYTKKGVFIKQWDSIKEACNTLNILPSNLGNCLNKRSASAGGYFWCYENEEFIKKIDGREQKIIAIKEDNKLIFENIKETAKHFNVKEMFISSNFYNKNPITINGYKLIRENKSKDIV